MDAIYAELSNLGTNYQEGEKCQQLTIGLSKHKDLLSTLQLLHTHPHTQTFTSSKEFLMNLDGLHNISSRSTRARGNLVHSLEQLDLDSDDELEDLQANANLTRFNIPNDAWRLMLSMENGREFLNSFRLTRDRLLRDKRQQGPPADGTTRPDSREEPASAPSDSKPAATSTGQRAGRPNMPRQYSANVATTTDDPSVYSHTTIAADNYRDLLEASHDEVDTLLSNVLAVHTTKAHVEWMEIPPTDGHSYDRYAISDDGADTCVCGKDWFPLKLNNRVANLFGYDPNTTKKTGLCIGTHADVMVSSDNREYLVILHQAVSNPTSPISLLSCMQLREHGIIVHNRSRRHLDEDGNPGKQCIIVPLGPTFNLHVRDGLMTLALRLPTREDMKRLPRVELTGRATWYPKQLYDDPLGIPSLVTTNDNAYTHVLKSRLNTVHANITTTGSIRSPIEHQLEHIDELDAPTFATLNGQEPTVEEDTSIDSEAQSVSTPASLPGLLPRHPGWISIESSSSSDDDTDTWASADTDSHQAADQDTPVPTALRIEPPQYVHAPSPATDPRQYRSRPTVGASSSVRAPVLDEHYVDSSTLFSPCSPAAVEHPWDWDGDLDCFVEANDSKSSSLPCDVTEFFDSLQGTDEDWKAPEPCYFFDPLDQLADEDHDGLALHLCIDYDMLETLPCDTTVCFLAAIPARELLGYCERMDTFAFAARAAVDLRRTEALQPYFGWRPLQVIRKT